jgi:hypothetical protein
MYLFVSLLLWPKQTASGESPAAVSLVGEAGGKIMWAGIWLIGAWLWLRAGVHGPAAISQAITDAPAGTGWLSWLERTASDLAQGHGTTIATVLAFASMCVGVGVFSDRWLLPALALGIGLSGAYWILGQGIGGIFTGSATDPGTGPPALLLAGALYRPSQRLHRPARRPARRSIHRMLVPNGHGQQGEAGA